MEDGHPLEDCYLKVERAKELLDQLRTEYDRARLTDPAVGMWFGTSARSGRQEARVVNVPMRPRKWGLIIGDIGNNLRAALDYLVFQLSKASEETRTSFPISETEEDYLRPRGRKKLSYRDTCLVGVEPIWAEKIDSFQGFNLPPAQRPGPLIYLNWLTNRDKHRIRHPVYNRIETPFGWLTIEGTTQIGQLDLSFTPPDLLDVNFSAKPPEGKRKGKRLLMDFKPKIEPDGQSGIEVRFGAWRMSLLQLVGLFGIVEHILAEFEPAFGPVAGPNETAI
jgi:hypothetical protein